MNWSKVLAPILVCVAVCNIGDCRGDGERKLLQSGHLDLAKACGSATKDSPCGQCPISITDTQARCDHACADLPSGYQFSDVFVQGGIGKCPNSGCSGASMSVCGGTGQPYVACPISHSRFEEVEYYPDTRRVCTRFKSWSRDEERRIWVHLYTK
jgi:hypothetical protein